MMHCSDKARALCAQRRCCGVTERGEFTTDSWCAGFNAGVAKALEQAIDLRPMLAAVNAAGEVIAELMADPEFAAKLAEYKADPTERDPSAAPQDDREIAAQDDKAADKEGSDAGT